MILKENKNKTKEKEENNGGRGIGLNYTVYWRIQNGLGNISPKL